MFSGSIPVYGFDSIRSEGQSKRTNEWMGRSIRGAVAVVVPGARAAASAVTASFSDSLSLSSSSWIEHNSPQLWSVTATPWLAQKVASQWNRVLRRLVWVLVLWLSSSSSSSSSSDVLVTAAAARVVLVKITPLTTMMPYDQSINNNSNVRSL